MLHYTFVHIVHYLTKVTLYSLLLGTFYISILSNHKLRCSPRCTLLQYRLGCKKRRIYRYNSMCGSHWQDDDEGGYSASGLVEPEVVGSKPTGPAFSPFLKRANAPPAA